MGFPLEIHINTYKGRYSRCSDPRADRYPSGWTECVALIVREQTLIVEALLKVRAALPFPLARTRHQRQCVHELHAHRLLRNYDIELTRSRA
jgi:hypothetical protein